MTKQSIYHIFTRMRPKKSKRANNDVLLTYYRTMTEVSLAVAKTQTARANQLEELAKQLAFNLETAIVLSERFMFPGPVLVKEWRELIEQT